MAPDFALWTCLDRVGCGGVVNLPVIRAVLNFPVFLECWFYNGVAWFVIGICAVFFFVLMLLYLPFVLAYYSYQRREWPRFNDLFPMVPCVIVSVFIAALVTLAVQVVWLLPALFHLGLTLVTSRCDNLGVILDKETLLRHFGRPCILLYERFNHWYGLDDDD